MGVRAYTVQPPSPNFQLASVSLTSSIQGPDNLQTLPMPEEVWSQVVLDAAKAAEPLEGEMTPSPLRDPRQVPETEESQVPADIPEDEGPAGDDLPAAGDPREGMTQADPEPKDARPDDLEQDLGDDSECDHFPMVRREDQHAFKDSKGKIQKMDSAPAAPAKPPQRGRAPTAIKRPAARAATRAKRSKMAAPVEVVASDAASESDDARQNLSDAFEAVASDGDDSAQPPQAIVAKAKAKTKSVRPRSAAKSRPEPKRVKTAGSHADGDTEAEKKKKKAEKPAKKEKREKAGEVKASKKMKSKAAEGEAAPEQAEDEGGAEEDGDATGKKTFAGRAAPKTGKAKLRFDVLRKVYENQIWPMVALNSSKVEARYLPKSY